VTAAASEKYDKRKVNRALRRLTEVTLQKDADEKVPPVKREVRDVWAMAKEGKCYFDAAGAARAMAAGRAAGFPGGPGGPALPRIGYNSVETAIVAPARGGFLTRTFCRHALVHP